MNYMILGGCVQNCSKEIKNLEKIQQAILRSETFFLSEARKLFPTCRIILKSSTQVDEVPEELRGR